MVAASSSTMAASTSVDTNVPKPKRAYTKRKTQTVTGDKENIPPTTQKKRGRPAKDSGTK